MAVDVDDWNGLQFHLDNDNDINLINDIDENSDGYSNFGSQWTADIAGDYTGVFDGQGYEIRDTVLKQSSTGVTSSQAFIHSIGDGTNSGTVKNLDLQVSINEIDSSTEVIGGLATFISSTATISDVAVEVSFEGDGSIDLDTAGGFAGNVNGDVSKAYSHGRMEITGLSAGSIGGFCSANNGVTISESFSSVDIASDASNSGGFCGDSVGGTFKNCYSLGEVKGPTVAGGFIGRSSGDVDYSYCTGLVSATEGGGGFVGIHGIQGATNPSGAVDNSYWDVENSEQGGGVYLSQSGSTFTGEGLRTVQMRGTSSLTEMDDLDFVNKWETVSEEDSDANFDGYPILQNIDRQEQIDIQKRRFGYSFSPIFRADSNLSITLNVGTNKKAITASFSNDSDLSVDLKRDFSSADLINNLFEAIGSVVFGGGEEVDEIDLVDSDTNILFSGSNSGQEVEIEFLLVESQTGGSNESIKSQRESIKKLPRRDAEENQFNYDGYTGFIAVDSVDLDEESDTSYVRAGTLSGVFLPWPKQFTDLDVGGSEFDVK
jgi:hypothetical protein